MAKNVYIPIVSKFDKSGVTQAESALGGFTKNLGKIAGALAAAFSVKAISDFVKESIGAAEAVQQANNRIGSIADSMGLFGDQTDAVSQRLIDFAESKELNLGVDAELIKAGQAQLLTFANLAETADEVGGAFDRATVLSADLAAAGFGSIDSASVALGKALQDPVGGITALRKAAVTFTDEQKALIEGFVEAGDMASAQNIILQAVEQQVGGTAEATALASDKIALAFDNIKEEAGAALLPLFEQLAPVLINFAEQVAPLLGAAFEAAAPAISQIIELLPGILSAFLPLIPVIGQIATVFAELVAAVLPVFANLIATLAPIVLLLAEAFLQIIQQVLTPILPLINDLITSFGAMLTAILPVLIDLILQLIPPFMQFVMQVITPLIPMVMALAQAFLPIIAKIFPMLAGLVAQLLPLLMDFFTNIIAPLIPVVFDLALAFLPLVDQILPLFIQIVSMLMPPLMQLLQVILLPMIGIIQFLAGVVTTLVDVAFAYLGFYIENVLMPIFQGIADFLNAILPPIIEHIQTYFEEMGKKFEEVGSTLEEVWGGFGDFFKGVANNMLGFFEGFINFVIDGLNSFFTTLDDIGQGLRDLSGGTVGWDVDFRIPKVSLPRLADGGIVMPRPGGVLAMLAEAGQPEAVIPLDRLGSMGGGSNVNITINAGVGTDPVSVGRAVVNAIKRYETVSGRVFLNV